MWYAGVLQPRVLHRVLQVLQPLGGGCYSCGAALAKGTGVGAVWPAALRSPR